MTYNRDTGVTPKDPQLYECLNIQRPRNRATLFAPALFKKQIYRLACQRRNRCRNLLDFADSVTQHGCGIRLRDANQTLAIHLNDLVNNLDPTSIQNRMKALKSVPVTSYHNESSFIFQQLSTAIQTEMTPSIELVLHLIVNSCSSLLVSMPDCGARGPRIEPVLWTSFCVFTKITAIRSN